MKRYKTILGAKGILPPLILNCYVLCTPAILKTDGANMVPSVFVCPYYTVTVPADSKKALPCNAHIPTILGCDLISYGVQITGIPL